MGASEIRDTTVAMQKFGTTASVSNVSTAESVALIETLADRQLKGEEAGVQLRNILAKLAGADILPKKALAELEQAGVSLDVLKDTTLPLITRLQELGKLQGNTAALTKVFGLENLSAAQIITQGIPKYEELLAGIQGTNEAYIQAGINADNAATRFQNLKNDGINLLTDAFLGIEPAISGVIELLSGFIDLLEKAPDLISENGEEFTALSFSVLAFTKSAQGAAISTTALATASGRNAAAQAISNAVTATGTIVTNALSAAQRAMPLLALIAGIYAVAKAFEAYEENASATEKATKAVADAQADIAKESAKETEAVRRNIEILKTDVSSKEESSVRSNAGYVNVIGSPYPLSCHLRDQKNDLPLSQIVAPKFGLTNSAPRSFCITRNVCNCRHFHTLPFPLSGATYCGENITACFKAL